MKNPTIDKARKFITTNRVSLQAELAGIDKQILELQQTKASLLNFLKVFDTLEEPATQVNGLPSLPAIPKATNQAYPVIANSDEGMIIAKAIAMREFFTSDIVFEYLKTAMPNTELPKHHAYNWISNWKSKGWLETIRPGEYKFNESFKTKYGI